MSAERSDQSAVERAEEALDRVTEPDQPRKYAESDEPAPEGDTPEAAAVLRAEQVREMGESWPGLGTPVMTDAQWKGYIGGSVIGGAIGAVLFLPVGFIPFVDFALGWRLLIAAIIGAVSGGTFAAIYFGGRMPELEGETMDADNTPSVGTTMADPGTDDRGRPL